MSSLLRRICRRSKPLLGLLKPRPGLLTFGIFLVLSSLFWLSTALNESYDYEIDVPVVLENVPENLILTSDITDTVRVMIKDKGFALMQYLYGKGGKKSVMIDFSAYRKQSGRVGISAVELHKSVADRLLQSTAIVSIKPERLDFSYVQGVAKSVPVRIVGQISPAPNHYLAHSQVSPSRVTVYAPAAKIDSIEYVITENVQAKNFTDTIEQVVRLKSPSAEAKVAPKEVKVSLYSDVLTEEVVEVPVEAVNVPEGMVLRTFPSRVKVRFAVGVSQYRTIQTSQFKVVVDYNNIPLGAEKCPLEITAKPRGVKNANLEIREVDYLIEN